MNFYSKRIKCNIEGVQFAESLIDESGNKTFVLIKHTWDNKLIERVTSNIEEPIRTMLRYNLSKKPNAYSICGYHFKGWDPSITNTKEGLAPTGDYWIVEENLNYPIKGRMLAYRAEAEGFCNALYTNATPLRRMEFFKEYPLHERALLEGHLPSYFKNIQYE